MRILLGIMLVILVSALMSATASASDLAVIKINNNENITFLNHASDMQENFICKPLIIVSR